MKTSYLQELGITDQKVIDAIMAENGRDIENAKKDYNTVVSKVEGLESQLSERDDQLKELKKSVKDNEALTAKITELETSNTSMKTEYENKIAAMQKDAEIESKLHEAKAKNTKAVKALLNLEDDLDKQIKTLKESEDTSFLFESVQQQSKPPAGSTPPAGNQTQPEQRELTFAERIANSLKS